MICSKCGRQMADDAVYCPNCGQLNSSSSQNQPLGAPAPFQQSPVYTPQNGANKKSGCLKIFLIVAAVAVGILLLMLIFGVFSEAQESYIPQTPTGGVSGTETDMGELREHYTQMLGGGEDKCTVMVYIIGSDLESGSGCASSDIGEMAAAGVGSSENVNVIVQTGGSNEWQIDGIPSDEVTRWRVVDESIEQLDSAGSVSMVDSDTLADFIDYCEENYPANRYMLVLWNHGGGTAWGFGKDENFPDDGSLMLDSIDDALKKADVKFDFVGYDACLMGSIENAFMLEKHADYLVGSEELEPGSGWDYTAWLSALVADPSIDTIELGKVIIDSFVQHNYGADPLTLSITELREIPYTYSLLEDYIDGVHTQLAQTQDFGGVSDARSKTLAFYNGNCDMIDICDFTNNYDGSTDGSALIQALESAVKYRNISSEEQANGLSMYFPYEVINSYESTRNGFMRMGISERYVSFFDEFVSILAGGQMQFTGYNSVSSILGGENAQEDYSTCEWYDPDVVGQYAAYYADHSYTEKEITRRDDGVWVMTLSDKEWQDINKDNILLQVIADLGDEGYLELGNDQMWSIEGNELIIDFDYTWVALNGQVIPYYAEAAFNMVDDENDESDDNEPWYAYGYVPATLTSDKYDAIGIDVIVKWDEKHPKGYVAGYRPTTSEGAPVAKTLMQFEKGDVIQPLASYYTKDGEPDGQYEFGDAITYNGSIAVSYEDIGNVNTLVSFMLPDIYNNQIFTETISFTVE